MKTPFAYLSPQVDDLYEKGLNKKLTSVQEINAHCEFIQDFIESNGWDIDDFIRTMMGFEDSNEEIHSN